jgi:hypothetical protein
VPDQFKIMAVGEFAAAQTEIFFSERKARADRDAFLRILNRTGGEPPRPDDVVDEAAP